MIKCYYNLVYEEKENLLLDENQAIMSKKKEGEYPGELSEIIRKAVDEAGFVQAAQTFAPS